MGSDPALIAPSGTGRTRKGSSWYFSAGAVIACAAVIIPAVVTWTTDRAELHAASQANATQDRHTVEQDAAIKQLQLNEAARDARDAALRDELIRVRSTLDRIADRVGAKP